MQSRASRENSISRCCTAWLCLALLVLSQATIQASHFRFGHLSWQRASGNTDSLVVEVTVVEAWRKDTSGPGSIVYTIDQDGTTFSSLGAAVIGTLTDIAGDEYEIYSRTITHTFPTNGVYTITSSQTFRLVDLVNAPATPVTLQLTLDLRPSNTGTPLTVNPVILQLPVNTSNSVAIPLVDPDSDPISVRFATAAESGIATIPSVGGNQMSVTPTGSLVWDTTGGTVGQRFAVQLAIDENHPGFTTSGRVPLEFMVELVNVATNQPPTCNGPSGNLSAQVGTPFSVAFSGTDPEGRPLALNGQQLPPGAILSPVSGSTNASPSTVQLQWVPKLEHLGQSFPVTVVFTDDGGLQASCGFAVTVSSILPLPAFDLVSVGATGSGNGASVNPVISRAARYVAFASDATSLVANDSNGKRDVFLRDRGLTNTLLVSATAGGTSGNGNSRSPVISADGRFVAFESDASDLVSGDNNGKIDVFIYDSLSNRTALVSVNASGSGSGAGHSFAPQFSADGRTIAFVSTADDLTGNDTNRTGDVFVRQLDSGTTVLVSANATGQSGQGASASPMVSTNGRYVAFASSAPDLVSGDTNNLSDIFRRDLVNNETRMVSVNQAGGPGNRVSFNPVISPAGDRVAFVSQATDLVALTDSNQQTDVFLRDLDVNITVAVSRNSAGTATANLGSSSPVFSQNGRALVFISIGTDLVATDTNGKQDVFLWRLVDPAPGGAPQLPGTLPDQTVELVSVNSAGNGTGNGASGHTASAVSDDLRYVAFFSDASDLVDGNADTNAVADIFIRDRTAGVTRLVSYDPVNNVLGNGASITPFLSADGDVIVFATDSSNLATNDLNGSADIVATALTNNVPTSLALSATIFLPAESPQGVDFPVLVQIANYGPTVVNNLQVANLGTGNLENVGLETTHGSVDPATEIWNIGSLAPLSAASLTLTIRGSAEGQAVVSATILPPLPNATIIGNKTAAGTVTILPPLSVNVLGPVAYGGLGDSPWRAGIASGLTRLVDGNVPGAGISRTSGANRLSYAFDRHVLGAAPTQVGLVFANATTTVTVEAFDTYGRRLGSYSAAASEAASLLGIESEHGIARVTVSGGGDGLTVGQLQLTIHAGVPVPEDILLWGTGETGSAGLIGDGYLFAGAHQVVLRSPVALTGNAASLEFWVSPTADLNGGTGWTPLAVMTEGTDDFSTLARGLDIYYAAGALSFAVPVVNGLVREVVRHPVDLRAGEWHHLAGIVADGIQTLYLNGSPIASRALTAPVTFNGGSLRLGQIAHAGRLRGYAGKIDEVSLYARALDAATIDQLHAQATRGKIRPQLSIRTVGSEKVLEWSGFFPGYQLEGGVNPAAGWGRWPAHPAVTDGLYRVSIPALSSYRYFQLSRPATNPNTNTRN